MATTLASQVQELYVGYLGRAADKAGLDFWVKAIESGTSTLESVALGFTLSEEYKAQYAGLTTTQLVAKVYQNVLGRAADADGLAFWAGEVNKGVIKAETLVKTMISSLGAIDQLTIDNKVAAANTYTVAAGDKYSVEAGKAAVAGAGVGTVPGVVTPSQTFTLTAGTDFADTAAAQRNVGAGTTMASDFKFTSANEKIVATQATAGALDVLTDGSTTDTDTYSLTANAGSALGTIANVENFEIAASGAAGYNITWTSITGAKSVTISGAVEGIINLTNPGASANLGFGGNATTGAGATTIDASGLTGNAGGINYSLAASSTTTDVTVKAGGSGASTITTGGGNDTIVGAAGADTLNGGAGNDTISGGAGNDIINGGAGNDTIDTGTGNNTVTGGAGNDTIALNGTIDTVIFNGVGLVDANGKDTITGFDAGTGAGADILNVFAQTAVGGGAAVATGTVTLTAAGALDFGATANTTANAVMVLDRGQAIAGQDYSTAADFAKVFGGTSAIHTTQTTSAGANDARVLVVQGTDQTQIYFVDANRDGTDTNITDRKSVV